MFICQIVSLAINPWYLLGSASVFIKFLASYQVFLSSITGVLICNYYIVARGYFKIPDLYTANKSGVYYFNHGWNFRAYIAYVLAICPNFAGFLGNMGLSMPMGITRFYYFAYPIGLVVSFGTFWVSNILWKPTLMMPLSEWHEPKNYIRPEEDIDGVVVLESASINEERPSKSDVEGLREKEQGKAEASASV